MTKNQIEYLKLLESQRANRAGEQETARANLERERQGVIQLGETERSNRAREGETNRHNLETERISYLGQAETERANRVRESQKDIELAEQSRANRAKEDISRLQLSETQRANQASEELRGRELAQRISYESAQTAARRAELAEKERSAKASEAISIGRAAVEAASQLEQARANRARETETALHNRAMELKDYSTKISYNGSPINVTQSGGSSEPTQQSSGSSVTYRPEPKLTGRSEYSSTIPTGIGSRNTYQYVTEQYSDGSTKYYREVVSFNGKVTSRQEVSKSQFSREAGKLKKKQGSTPRGGGISSTK